MKMMVKVVSLEYICAASRRFDMPIGMLYIALAASSWGTLGILASGLIAVGFNGFEVAALRVLLSACVLLVISPRVLRPHLATIRRHWPILCIHSLIGVFFYNVLYFIAIEEVGVTFSVGLLYTAPIWALVFSIFILGERLSWLRSLSALGACTGVMLTLGVGGVGSTPSVMGVLLGLAAGATYALYPVIGKRAIYHVPPTVLLFSSFLISGLAFASTPPAWDGVARLMESESLSVWMLLLTMSLFGTIFSYFLFTRGIKMVPASSVGVVTTLEPLVAIVLASALLNEHLTILQYFGIFLIVLFSILSGLLNKQR
ncbi:DMT family transporter [Vreelandella subglaciescola]|jgi:drug/metabolite transporter (DMT)-like permease|uniref:Threonine/homoserine efflux transporter RhtA n=1 Tax=Vreelandella subglaciescola TaxID=29571 RepID=A0A1M7H741_9GAMM|nr:EamA family transporter [Halomonas subglaciescola]SHM24166.1 Threonine/homoserine efflux transporter RhtA [Halomonas subglaciescola]